jgi:hypothetical protein
MLYLILMNVEHEDVVCRFFPYTFQGKASPWFFNLAPRSITSWKLFETTFMEQFGDDKTSGIFFLELSRIKINKKEKVKDFNHRFITLLNRILENQFEAVQIEFYTTDLLLPISMFIKIKEKWTLAENFQEAIKVEKDLTSISSHPRNEENTTSTSERNSKKNEGISKTKSEKEDKELKDMESMQQMIKQIMNEIIDLKKNKSEGNKPFNPFLNKKVDTGTSSLFPPTLGINLEDYDMNNLCRSHHANHSERTCPEFINSFKEMTLPQGLPKEKRDEEEGENDDERKKKKGKKRNLH